MIEKSRDDHHETHYLFLVAFVIDRLRPGGKNRFEKGNHKEAENLVGDVLREIENPGEDQFKPDPSPVLYAADALDAIGKTDEAVRLLQRNRDALYAFFEDIQADSEQKKSLEMPHRFIWPLELHAVALIRAGDIEGGRDILLKINEMLEENKPGDDADPKLQRFFGIYTAQNVGLLARQGFFEDASKSLETLHEDFPAAMAKLEIVKAFGQWKNDRPPGHDVYDRMMAEPIHEH